MRDDDQDIRRSLERLTGPAGDPARVDELWGELVGRRRRRRGRNGALVALPMALVVALAVGVLSEGSDDSGSNVAARDGASGEGTTAERGGARSRCDQAVADLAEFEAELVDASTITPGEAAELAERLDPLGPQPWSGMPDDSVVVRCDLRVGRPSPGSNTAFVGPEAFVLLGPDGQMTSHSPGTAAGPSPSDSCGGTERPFVPTPEIGVDGEMIPLELVSISGCGIEADGALNLGADPTVVTVGRVVRLHASPEFRVFVSVAGYEDAPEPDEEVAEVGDGIFEIELADHPCGLLTVTLNKGDMSGRFAGLLEVADGDCREAVGDSATPAEETTTTAGEAEPEAGQRVEVADLLALRRTFGRFPVAPNEGRVALTDLGELAQESEVAEVTIAGAPEIREDVLRYGERTVPAVDVVVPFTVDRWLKPSSGSTSSELVITVSTGEEQKEQGESVAEELAARVPVGSRAVLFMASRPGSVYRAAYGGILFVADDGTAVSMEPSLSDEDPVGLVPLADLLEPFGPAG